MLPEIEITERLLAAAAASAVLGWEREWRQKPAGLRTHMLVAVGAAAFMQAAVQLHLELWRAGQSGNADLLKVLGGIVGGVGFLGAGSILRSGGEVQGLTTAATVWVAAAVGVACGLGYFVLAINCTVIPLLILVALGFLERRLLPEGTPPREDA